MELAVMDTKGLPDGCILSVRSGTTHRQSCLPCAVPFKLAAGGPRPLRIDVLSSVAKSQPGANLKLMDPKGRCKVPLESRDGRKMSVTLQVFEGKCDPNRSKPDANGEGLEEPEAEDQPVSKPPRKKVDTEGEARAYLAKHQLPEFMHALFELLLRERPEDPYASIAGLFQEAARAEAQSQPLEMPAALPPASSSCSRALPPSQPATASEAPQSQALGSSERPCTATASTVCPTPLIEGGSQSGLHLHIRTMRGRMLSRLCATPTETVLQIKKRLETSLRVPASRQQLYWWGEALPNDTTLEDHGVVDGGQLHLVTYVREPRLSKSLSGSSDGGMKIWNLEDGEVLKELSAPKKAVIWAMSVDWLGFRAVTGAHDGTVHLWDLEKDVCCHTFEQHHEEEINCLQASWPQMRALTGSGDGAVILWDLQARVLLYRLPVGAAVYSLAVDWTKGAAYAGLKNGLVRCWILETCDGIHDHAQAQKQAQKMETAVSAVAIDEIGERAVSALEDGRLIYWHFALPEPAQGEAAVKPKELKVMLAHYSAMRIVAAKWVQPNDNDPKYRSSRALCGSDDGTLSLWLLDTAQCIARFARHVGFVWALHADWHNERAVSGAFDGCVKLWDLRTGECLRTLQAHSRPVRSICAS
jgi:WD40 repeat protein